MQGEYHKKIQELVPGITEGMMYEDALKLIYEKLMEQESHIYDLSMSAELDATT